MRRRFFYKRILTVCILFMCFSCDQHSYTPEKGQVIACIGDSITYSNYNGYAEYLQKYVDENHPDLNLNFLNWGKNSETITNLTEKGHPGPRPYIFDRLDYLLAQSPKPDVVTFCYGMNCGIYGKPSEELFESYKKGLNTFLERMERENIKVILLTTPPLVLETARLHGNTKLEPVADDFSWLHPYEGYEEEVLQRFREIIWNTDHPSIVKKIDIHTPLLKNADKAYGIDPIHPNQYGNEIVANTIIKAIF